MSMPSGVMIEICCATCDSCKAYGNGCYAIISRTARMLFCPSCLVGLLGVCAALLETQKGGR
jgi:hypothetical protein